MKPNLWLAFALTALMSPTAFAQSQEIYNPGEAMVTSFAPGAPLQVLGSALLDLRPQLITHPGGGSGGADESRLQTTSLGMGTIGFGAQQTALNRIADDFVVPAGGWTVNAISVYTYQTGSTTTSTITGLTLRIWNGAPNVGGSTVVFGDDTTNVLSSTAFTNIFRVTETTVGGTTRPIMSATASGLNINLPAGTYWLDWALSGSLASGPWAPPISILGTAITGNGLQFTTPTPPTGTWNPAVDGGTGTPAQGFPFTIEGIANNADVGITKIAIGAGSLSVGSAFSYDLAVSNAGPIDATGVTITDTLPAQLNYVSNTCGATFAAPTLTWTVGNLANAASATCTINVTVNAGGAISNTATVATTTIDPTPANNSATADVTATALNADLALTKVAQGTAGLAVGGSFSYLLTVNNAGPGDATGVSVTDTLPAQVTYVSDTCGATFAAPTLTWTVGALANAASATCTINVIANTAGMISNTASVAGTSTDPTPGNNSATADVTAGAQSADVSLTKTAQGGAGLNIGSPFTFTLTVSNAGPGAAAGVVVTDTLPASVNYVGNNCGAAYVAPTLTWTVGALANAASASCIIDVTVAQPGQITNNASVTATSPDANGGNNAASAIVAGASFRAVPANSTLALLALLLGVLSIGAFAIQRR